MPRYEFDVLIHGKSVTKYVHEGRVYIEGRANSNFTILIRNNTGDRALAVITVDGLSIMDGKKGTQDGTGYVLNPHETLKIPGWRLDDDAVASFKFGGKDNSYAASKGDARNVGVIGCAVFEEDRPAWWITSSNLVVPCSCPSTQKPRGSSTGDPLPDSDVTVTCSDASPFTETSDEVLYSCNAVTYDSNVAPGTYRAGSYKAPPSGGEQKTSGNILRSRRPQVQNIGTEFGKRTAHAVAEVTFNRKDRPTEVFAIHYDDRAGLKARGINLDRKVHVANPFPKDSETGCEPPASWRG
jgi:hypothetical protein